LEKMNWRGAHRKAWASCLRHLRCETLISHNERATCGAPLAHALLPLLRTSERGCILIQECGCSGDAWPADPHSLRPPPLSNLPTAIRQRTLYAAL
jgi:hypothetical protein